MEKVPCRTSCAHPLRTLLCAYFDRSGNIVKGAFSFPGATWDHLCCTVERSPGHIRCRKELDTSNFLGHIMRAILSVRPNCSHICVSLKNPR